MAAQIKYLSFDLTLGGYQLALETDNTKLIADLEAIGTIQDKIKAALATGVTFRMEKGKVISVSVKDLIDWATDKIDHTLGSHLTTFFHNATSQNALDAIIIDVWNLAIEAKEYDIPLTGNIAAHAELKLSFTFFIRVNLGPNFYSGIFGTNQKITDIIKINSVGFGMYYSNI